MNPEQIEEQISSLFLYIELLGKELAKEVQRFTYLCKLLKRLDAEVEQKGNQLINLESRIYALEEKIGGMRGTKYVYK